MPQVSKKVLDKNVSKKIQDIFLETLSNLKNKDEANQFMYDLLTPTERVMLGKRLAITLMIFKGYAHRDISEALKVSTSTISIITDWLRHEGQGYRQVIKKIIKKEKLRALWYKIDYYLKGPMPGAGGSKEDFKEMYKKQYESQPIETPLVLVLLMCFLSQPILTL
ncbi:unnamed protein product [marine sediment metagenome]|uniref:TrpR like protein, YerC/YecD n=1 Tax=marine sediment metagenome TaxID=412755 RepID=X0U0V4_9ZZZZ